MAEFKYGMYHQGSFRRGSHSDTNLIKCEDKNVTPSKLQSYVLHWYLMYLLHPVIDLS